ncbi:hypothetical protein V8G54_036724 [Vigna mungo]|uniref:GDSL esterase/lipase n=1 Tax=Vigna mungo TaxID=3915 RepID=A0AAQ3RGV9_VIGMU
MFIVVAAVIGILSTVHGQHQDIANAPANENNVSDVSAFYVLGDSSVDCGDNTLFHPLLHGRLSFYPCNGSDATLLPQLLDWIHINPAILCSEWISGGGSWWSQLRVNTSYNHESRKLQLPVSQPTTTPGF